MKPYIIAYDLKEPGQKYDQVQKVISRISGTNNVEIEKSVWLVKSSLDPENIRTSFSSVLDKNDLFFVCELKKNFRTQLDPQSCVKLLRDIF